MEVTLKQAVILQAIANSPGITGPMLTKAIEGVVPLLNVPQHLGRLKRKNLVTTKKVPGSRAEVNSFYLTKAGEKELKAARQAAKVLLG